ncbi:4-(cytidine 5'-diphospho)-2-C-methyl-D-erythritol kinase [Niabella insulamsoli]|uniref:4-(cytidine 5'-diphospho)-2-C-methyl-D-erythritol kinase n=1 Tax=Niabella insulamsoli TaxID=3144874 RepID=UPI0031FE2616
MISFSNCKINIGLYITGKRPDGYHDLQTLFYPLPVYDVLELAEAAETGIAVLGKTIPGNSKDNIVIKAWQLLQRDFKTLPPVQFHLLKNTPAGAGLGAGSANGAYALKALNEKFNLNLTRSQLVDYALQLGSDCPFFIMNTPVFATGRGERFEASTVDLTNYQIMVVNPGIHVVTGWAFSQLTPALPQHDLKQSLQQPVAAWKDLIFNDFEPAVFEAFPEIAAIKKQLYEAGARFALMSGSGSTVYGLFDKATILRLSFPSHYFVKIIQ